MEFISQAVSAKNTKKILLLIALFVAGKFCQAQEYALNNSGTLYDSFENPVQGTSTKDVSRKYAFNFFLPTVSNSIYFNGDANTAFKTMLFTQKTNAKDVGSLGEAKINNLRSNSNNYLLMFKIFKSVKYKSELGFALQLRHDLNMTATNETFAILDNFNLFTQNNYSNVIKGSGYSQSYSQLSVTYRNNYDKYWALGGKISILNGISLVKYDIKNTTLEIDRVNNIISQTVNGSAFSSFGANGPKLSVLIPNFKNPGLSVSFGAAYTALNGTYFSGNIKDLGFIKWNKNSTKFDFDTTVDVYEADSKDLSTKVYDKFGNMLTDNQTTGSTLSHTNAKLEFLASKTFDFYKPNLIVAKHIFEQDGAIALINNFNYKIYNIALNGIYDFRQGFNVGSQFMVKAPNVEFFMGSEKLLPSVRFVNGILNSDPNTGNNPTRADFYMGFSLKFGKMMQNFTNADEIPGLNDPNNGYLTPIPEITGGNKLFNFLKRVFKPKKTTDAEKSK